MTENLRLIAKKKHFFIYLLPVFFVLHGFTYNYNLVNLKTTAWVLGAYLLAAFLLSRLSYLFFRDRYKANLFAFTLLFMNFFFGYIYEGLNKISKTSFFGKYSFLMLVFALLIALVFYLLKKKKTINLRIGMVLNIFLICLLIVETSSLILKLMTPNKFALQLNTSTLEPCKDCKKPDIYFILTDGYAGPAELKDVFNFDNSAFDSALISRKFHIIRNTSSNYNFTELSMASLLNMSYLVLNEKNYNKNTHGCINAIKRNQVANFMKMNGYQVINNSIFQMDESEKEATFLFPGSTALLLGSTLVYHIARIIEYKMYGNKSLQIIHDGQLSTIKKSNNLLYDKTIEVAGTPSNKPRFVYTHLLMPHFPYFYDKDGKETSNETIKYENRFSEKDYLSYLQYVTGRLLSLIDSIQKRSLTPPIIMLLSDHGFRQFQDEKKVDARYFFSNINALYFPNGDYTGFYDGITNVNMFRTLFNTQFNQKMEILKDSTIYRDY